ncbi:MAG: TIGR04282 family arsenosugar biosynthesis glycosyltransferase [Candidatus Hodarchaeales archaeon]|jgi:glycosyltransferase A (GT-A) superfamily protein (DUF2064 family)
MSKIDQLGVIIFSKVPKQGFVKTRIIHPELPKNFQFKLQIAMILDTFACLATVKENFIPILSFYPREEKELLDELIIKPMMTLQPDLSSKLLVVPQKGITVAERFQNSFSHVFTNMSLSSALIIGTDTPHIQPALITKGIQLLQQNVENSVLGPSQEGGFYLLGYNKPFLPDLNRIFAQGNQFKELGQAYDLLSNSTEVHILPFVPDIDRFTDLITFINLMKLLIHQDRDTNNSHVPKNTINLLNTLEEYNKFIKYVG